MTSDSELITYGRAFGSSLNAVPSSGDRRVGVSSGAGGPHGEGGAHMAFTTKSRGTQRVDLSVPTGCMHKDAGTVTLQQYTRWEEGGPIEGSLPLGMAPSSDR